MSPAFLLAFKIIDLIMLGVQLAPQVKASFATLKAELQVFVDEGRDPTPEEWGVVNAKIDSLILGIMED